MAPAMPSWPLMVFGTREQLLVLCDLGAEGIARKFSSSFFFFFFFSCSSSVLGGIDTKSTRRHKTEPVSWPVSVLPLPFSQPVRRQRSIREKSNRWPRPLDLVVMTFEFSARHPTSLRPTNRHIIHASISISPHNRPHNSLLSSGHPGWLVRELTERMLPWQYRRGHIVEMRATQSQLD